MKRIVIKLGTGILTKGLGEIDTDRIASICQQVHELKERGLNLSSSVREQLAWAWGLWIETATFFPRQATSLAAIGQSRLIHAGKKFPTLWLVAGQVLLTHEGLRIRNRYVNAKATIDQLINCDAIPVINENDTVSAFEIKFGNNDILVSWSQPGGSRRLFILSTAPD